MQWIAKPSTGVLGVACSTTMKLPEPCELCLCLTEQFVVALLAGVVIDGIYNRSG